jgi:VanZ family protein
MLWLAPVLAAYGGAIELVQPMVGRGRELADWLADLAGIGLGALVGVALRRVWQRGG